jgi:mannose-6-phosphate isomerase-like protein (cupin superfamily)
MRNAALLLSFCAAAGLCQERRVDPTFIRRPVAQVQAQPDDLTSATCRYKPVFGAGDRDAGALRGIVRYGEAAVDAGGASAVVNYPAEEQVYVILEGSAVLVYGGENREVRRNDFMYLPPGVAHGIRNPSAAPCRFLVMGFRIPKGTEVKPPPKLLIANIDDVPKQTVSGHPPSTQYRLLMGDVNSKRDRLAAARVLTSLFVMEFAPGGTNIPHHHDEEEEIYLVLEGRGDMVAGPGMDGIEGRHPSQAGDAWFFRLNCTVGFYNGGEPGAGARILAVRSLYPRR